MFLAGQIVYFNEFYFKNENTAKPKYFIILANINDEVIIASLPTRTNHASSLIDKSHGCVNIDDRCFNAYVFEANRTVTTNGFSFPFTTFLYGDEIEDYEISILLDVYSIEGVDYDIIGQLLPEKFNAIISCVCHSSSVKRKIKRLLNK